MVFAWMEGPHQYRENATGFLFSLGIAFCGGFVARSFWSILVVPIAMSLTGYAYRTAHGYPEPRELTGAALVTFGIFYFAVVAIAIVAGVLMSGLAAAALSWSTSRLTRPGAGSP
jgi:hypothetical protein